MGTLYQNAISCPRLRIAMSEDPATSSSFKWVTLPKLIDFFGTECFCSRTFLFTAKPESMPALKKELATRLVDETMQIADMYYVRLSAKIHRTRPAWPTPTAQRTGTAPQRRRGDESQSETERMCGPTRPDLGVDQRRIGSDELRRNLIH